jgi:hypothetical protein
MVVNYRQQHDVGVERGGPGGRRPRWRLSHGGGGVVPDTDRGEQGPGGGEQVSSATYMARKSTTQVRHRLSAHSRSNVHRGHNVGSAVATAGSMDGREVRSKAQLTSGGFSASNQVM